MALSSGLPAPLQSRLAALPASLRDHIERVRPIARSLAATHGADAVVADLAAAAHDVARHLPGAQLIEEAERLGLPVSDLERRHPVLLHGPVGAAWLRNDGTIDDPEVLEGVHWHTTGHPSLAPVGRVVFLADKLDPAKAQAYPHQEEVRERAFASLEEGMLAFLGGALRQHLADGGVVHPAANDTRNALLLGMAC